MESRNELIPVKVEGQMVSFDESALIAEIGSRVELLKVMAVAPSTVTACDEVRKAQKRYLKGIASAFDEARKCATAKIDEIEAHVNELTKPLKDENERFDKAIKEADAVKFRETLREKYFKPAFGMPDENGEFLDFDSIYEPEWSKLTYAKANAVMVAKIMADKRKDEEIDLIIQISHISNEVWKEVESVLIKNRVVYDILSKERK